MFQPLDFVTPSAGFGGGVVLVVDDEDTIRRVVADFLRDFYDVIEASSADEAVAVLSTECRVDLVISDIRMPGTMDGFGLARWLRGNHPDMPIMLMSGYSAPPPPTGPDKPYILIKPFNFDRMLNLVAEMIERPIHQPAPAC
ncbi:MAG: response regulator [Proteobacteria bacterium]|nr:response regulator [Pseudomonadota bacterium]